MGTSTVFAPKNIFRLKRDSYAIYVLSVNLCGSLIQNLGEK